MKKTNREKQDSIRRRQALRDSLQSIAKKRDEELQQYSRQVDYDGIFDTYEKEAFGGTATLLRPPYLPGKMYELFEQSSKLEACIAAYVDNIDGFGYDIVSTVSEDDDIQGEDNPQAKELKDFFDAPNDTESFITIREKLRRDLEVTGNAFLEVVRGRDGKPVLAFWMDAKRVRISTTRDSVIQNVEVVRAGQLIQVPAEKRYRSYCMLTSDGSATGPKARYFKAYGDPRTMDAESGEFRENPKIAATEVIHFKIGNDTYGIPRWIGTMLNVMGMWKSNLVNYDLFDNQGVPPMIITVAGGNLTDESFKDLVDLFRKAKGVRNFHKLLVLEAESNSGSLEGKDTAPRLEVQNMTEYRKEDAMFLSYLEYCSLEIQKNGFRLPGMFLGISDDANYATAFIVRKSAEEQLFIPERRRFDEIINKTIVKDFGVKDLAFRSNGPVLQSADNIPQVLSTLIQAGVFTVNGLISFVNTHLGTNIAMYDDAWADEPIGKAATVEQPEFEEETEEVAEDAISSSEQKAQALEQLSSVLKSYAEGGCACGRVH